MKRIARSPRPACHTNSAIPLTSVTSRIPRTAASSTHEATQRAGQIDPLRGPCGSQCDARLVRRPFRQEASLPRRSSIFAPGHEDRFGRAASALSGHYTGPRGYHPSQMRLGRSKGPSRLPLLWNSIMASPTGWGPAAALEAPRRLREAL